MTTEKHELVKSEETRADLARRIPIMMPRVDLYENSDEILIHADMPGVAREDVSVSLENGTLIVKGLRRIERTGTGLVAEFGEAEYGRVFAVPPGIDSEKVRADLKDGVLHLHLPKAEAVKPRTIAITAG